MTPPDVLIDALLVVDALWTHARRLRVHLTIAAITLAAIGGLLLIASRTGG